MDPEVKRQLDLRLAKGEITREEYSDTLKALTEGDRSVGSTSIFSNTIKRWLDKDPLGEHSYKNIEPTDEVPLVVNDELSLFGSTLKFRQTILRYSDIRSLSYDGLRSSTNGKLSHSWFRLGILSSSGDWIKVLGEWKPTFFLGIAPPTVIKVKLVENACSFLAPLTFQQRMQLYLEEIVRNGYIDICKTQGKPEVRLYRDGFIEKEGLRISLSQAHSRNMIELGRSSYNYYSYKPGEFVFGQTGMSILSQRIIVKVWIDRDVATSIINHLAEGKTI